MYIQQAFKMLPSISMAFENPFKTQTVTVAHLVARWILGTRKTFEKIIVNKMEEGALITYKIVVRDSSTTCLKRDAAIYQRGYPY